MHVNLTPEASSIGVIAEQTNVILYAKHSHGPIIQLCSFAMNINNNNDFSSCVSNYMLGNVFK